MTNETPNVTKKSLFQCFKRAPKARPKSKRDILRFNGSITKAIDLGKCISIDLLKTDKKIIFRSAQNEPDFIQLDSEDAAASVYESILKIWAADVLE